VARLKPRSWLNDEIVTFYGVLINMRSAEAEKAGTLEKEGLLKAHCMSSFFMGVFEKKGHAGVKKWTKKVSAVSILESGGDGWVLRTGAAFPG